MSLNWNATEVKDLAAIGVGLDEKTMTLDQKIEWAKTEHIIFASLVTGLGPKWRITEADAAETFDRLSAYEHVTNEPIRTMSNGKPVSHWLTFDDVKKRIGLSTNCSWPTRAKFERQLGQILMRDAADRRRS